MPLESAQDALTIIFSPKRLQGPIQKMNLDVLCYIFSIVAEESEDTWQTEYGYLEETEALSSIRSLSEVCRTWRETVIGASSLWGKLININTLKKSSALWRSTVLSRSKMSHLWIRGCVDIIPGKDDQGNPHEQFLFLLLNQHFGRIERFVIYARQHYTTSWIPTSTAAPLLRIFKITVGSSDIYHDSRSPLPIADPLFFHGAPLLEKLTMINFVHFSSRSASWMSNIRELKIGFCAASYELFNCLSAMKNLYSLDIHGATHDDQFTPHQISLPNVRKLTLRGIFGNLLPFIVYLRPGIGCFFTLKAKHSKLAAPAIQDLFNVQKLLVKLFQEYCQLHLPQSLRLTLAKEQFILRDVHLDNHSHGVEIDAFVYNEDEPQDYLVPFYLHLLESTNMSEVRELKLRLDFRTWMAPHVALPFWELASAFKSLTTLRISEYSIDILLKTYSLEAASLFPQIQVLSMNFLMNDVNNTKRCGAHRLAEYLKKRQEMGLVLGTLELAELTYGDGDNTAKDYDLRALNGFSNLLVIWPVDGVVIKYQCGGGNEETLRYSNHVMHWSGSPP